MTHKTDTRLIALADPAIGLALLSRWPVRIAPDLWARGAASAWCWPLLGGVIALPAAFIANGCLYLGLPPMVAALFIVATMAFTTGALHEDGLADTFDGLWGGIDRARRLAIMKDSHIGTYGTLALIFGVALRVTLIEAFMGEGTILVPLLSAAILSRLAMVGVMTALPHARTDGLARTVGRPGYPTFALATIIACAAVIAFLGINAVLPIFAAVIGAVCVAAFALRKIGGQTGDILGATQQVGEICVLLALLI